MTKLTAQAPRRWSSDRKVVHKPRQGLSVRHVPLRNHVTMAAHFGHNYLRKYYQDTFLGLLWVPLRPLTDIFLGTLLFGGFLQVSSGGRPYILFLVVGSIGWALFERVFYWGYRGLQYNQRYFRSIPVPWLPAITGSVVPGVIQAALYFMIAFGIAIYFLITDGHFWLDFGAATGLVFVGLAVLVLYGWFCGLIFGPIVRQIRDVRLLLPFPLAILQVVTPVVYPIEAMPEKYKAIALYNPLTAPVELVRHGLLGMALPAIESVVTTVAVIAVALPIGMWVFLRAERSSHARL